MCVCLGVRTRVPPRRANEGGLEYNYNAGLCAETIWIAGITWRGKGAATVTVPESACLDSFQSHSLHCGRSLSLDPFDPFDPLDFLDPFDFFHRVPFSPPLRR